MLSTRYMGWIQSLLEKKKNSILKTTEIMLSKPKASEMFHRPVVLIQPSKNLFQRLQRGSLKILSGVAYDAIWYFQC